ncbi:hypothetical protein [Azospirillum doebereinerae]
MGPADTLDVAWNGPFAMGVTACAGAVSWRFGCSSSVMADAE